MSAVPVFAGLRALVVSSDFPYPTIHGGRVDIWGRLKALSRLGFDIDLLATVKAPPDPADVAHVMTVVRTVRTLERRRGPLQMLGLRPFQMASRSDLASVPLHGTYDLVLLEGSYVMPVLDNPALQSRLTVLKMHNDEAVYCLELARSTRNPLKRIFLLLEYLRFSRENAMLAKHVKTVFFSSNSECIAFKHRSPELDVAHLGGALLEDQVVERPRNGAKVLFSGSLFMPNNQDAIEWYLREAHPHLLDIPGYELMVVGRSSGVSSEWLSRLRQTQRVALHENVPDMDPYYESAAVFVNPMQFGTSIKMKTIEALRNGVPVVSTSCGAMGDRFEDGTHLLIADQGKDFAAAVRSLLTNRALNDRIAAGGHQLIREDYDHAAKLVRLLGPRLGNS